jgi:hypothetical protein
VGHANGAVAKGARLETQPGRRHDPVQRIRRQILNEPRSLAALLKELEEIRIEDGRPIDGGILDMVPFKLI